MGEAMREFLDAIWLPQGEGFAEYRLISNDGKVNRGFRSMPDELDELIAQMHEQDNPDEWPQNFNIFVGVLLRDRRAGTADAVKTRTPVLWADFDTKNFKDRMATFYAVQQMSIPPQIVIDSGHGFHAYWLLDGTVDVKIAQRIMNGMATKYGSDKVGDPARVMRVPGTHNKKDEPNMLVRMIKFDPLERSRIGDFYSYIEEENLTYYSWGPRTAKLVDDERLNRTPPKGQRSEYIFGIVIDMIRVGKTLGDVWDTLIDSVAGQKLREMDENSALRWMQRTYEQAQKAARLEN